MPTTPEEPENSGRTEYTAVFVYAGIKDVKHREIMATKKMLKDLLRSYGFQCREILAGNWRDRDANERSGIQPTITPSETPTPQMERETT